MTPLARSRKAFWPVVTVFSLMVFAHFVLPSMFDVTVYSEFLVYYDIYNLCLHSIILTLLKVARLAMSEPRHLFIADFFIALMWGDVIDRILGVTWFDPKDLYIAATILTLYVVKYRKTFLSWLPNLNKK